MNIVFMGTPEYAAKILCSIAEAKFEIAAVFTQPDKPVGRKQILTPSEVKTYAQQHLPRRCEGSHNYWEHSVWDYLQQVALVPTHHMHTTQDVHCAKLRL